VTTYVGVIDIGKTNAKCAIVDIDRFEEVAVLTTPNRVLDGAPYRHFDIEGIWAFLTSAIAKLNAEYRLSALSITTHGACAALVADDGGLALPVLDYESDAPDRFAADYDAARPDFAASYSPRLPGGLNLGAQLYYQAQAFPKAFAKTKWILTYPQYWAWRLTDVAASELTSIGCHTDLWDFGANDFSALAKDNGWTAQFPPIRKASDVLGPVRENLIGALGLDAGIPVYCGIHDSNASLVPHILGREGSFSVVSTGTWVISCTPNGALKGLDPERDSLANIDAFGRPVPSARFMGGREFSSLITQKNPSADGASMARVLDEAIMLLPSVQQGSGPFPNRKARWSQPADSLPQAELYCTVSFYLAMMSSVALSMTGGCDDIVVEGPFASNLPYCRMLASATGRPVIGTKAATGTSIGAALLTRIEQPLETIEGASQRHLPEPGMALYAKRWLEAA